MPTTPLGWRVVQPNDPALKTFTVPGTKARLRLWAPVAPLLLAFASAFHRTVEHIDTQRLADDWGYAYREVRGGGSWSEHTAAAIDINATVHPLGRRGTFKRAAQVKQIKALCKTYHLRWGGSYLRRADEMHFEVLGPASAATQRIRDLGLDANGRTKPKPLGTPVPPRGTLRKVSLASVAKASKLGATHDGGFPVEIVQKALGVKADGRWGPITTTAWKRWQKKLGYRQTGHPGKLSLTKLGAARGFEVIP